MLILTSTLLTKEDTYKELYIDNQDLDVFYNAAVLGKKIEQYLKKSNMFSQAQKNDIIFYVIFYAVAKQLDAVDITARCIKEIDQSLFTEEYIINIANQVLTEYTALGGDSTIAKGTNLIKKLKEMI